ncbi:hypothetical protein C0993_003109 [Termitomyces sp. T159_Od127]|nr:hypothetical protein C0993_003109 [Termitomyces sp. T159_Od127]
MSQCIYGAITAFQKALLEAVTRVESFLTPVTEELEREKAEKAAIKEELNVLKRSQKESDELHARCAHMEIRLQEAEYARNAALVSKEKAKRHLQRGVDEIARLNKLHEKFDHALKTQKEEIAKLEITLKEANNDKHVLKKKLRILTKQYSKPAVQDSHPEDSLQILEPEEEVRFILCSWYTGH